MGITMFDFWHGNIFNKIVVVSGIAFVFLLLGCVGAETTDERSAWLSFIMLDTMMLLVGLIGSEK